MVGREMTLNSILILILMFWSQILMAGDFHLLEVRDLSVEYNKYQGVYRNSYLLNQDGTFHQLDSGGSFNLNVDLLKFLYTQNRVHLAGDETQVKYVGWEWESGLRLGSLEGYWHHHSQHELEGVSPRGDKYPLENYVGVRVHLIGGPQ